MHRLRMIVILILVLALGIIAAPSAAQDTEENLLANGGFEGEYTDRGGETLQEVALNWEPWFLPPPADAESTSINQVPAYNAATSDARVRTGEGAQEYNTFFATHDAGLYQRVPVEPGAELTFSVYIYAWSSATFADPNESVQPQDMIIQVGIDPTGGTDGGADSIVWSETDNPLAETDYDQFIEYSVSAVADATAVTVFIRSNPQGEVGVNHVYVDDATLIQTGVSTVADDPQPVPEPTQEVADASDSADAETEDEANADTSDEPDADATDEPDADATDEPDADATDEPDSDATAEAEATPEATDIPQTENTEPFPNRLTVTVQAGDTVAALATEYQSTAEAIIDANGLNDQGLILVGQQLVVPTPDNIGEPAVTATPEPTDNEDADAGNANSDTPVTGNGTHVVQAGENLYRIALQYNTTVEALATLNNITNPNLISAGTILQVPGATTPATNNNNGTGGATNTGTHTVQAGENLFRIGLLYNVTVTQLVQVNNLANPNIIFVGQVLVIP